MFLAVVDVLSQFFWDEDFSAAWKFAVLLVADVVVFPFRFGGEDGLVWAPVAVEP